MLLWLAAASVAAPCHATAAAALCKLEFVSGRAGENHVMFHGLSPDGRKLAIGWDRGSGPGVHRGAFLLDLRTGRRTEVPQLNNAPSFSPNRRFLVSANYASDTSLRTEIVELDRRTGKTRTYASGPSGEWLASYSSDGKWIVFNSTRTGRSDLYRVRRSDAAAEQLTNDPRYEAHAHFFDGDRKLIFHRQTTDGDYDVIIRDLRTGAEHSVGATAAEEAYPAISPDGQWIAFSVVTQAGTQPHLFVMRSDGSGRQQLTDDRAKDAYAAWAPDGRAIYFVRFAKTGSTIYRLSMRGGSCR